MTSISFDTDFDTLRNPEYRYVVRAIEDSNVRLGVLLQAPEVGIGNIDNKLFPEALIARKKFVKIIRMILGKRLSAAKTPSKDIFSFLQQCKDPETGEELTTAELSTETATFIVAGK
jgi:cytochrome P450